MGKEKKNIPEVLLVVEEDDVVDVVEDDDGEGEGDGDGVGDGEGEA